MSIFQFGNRAGRATRDAAAPPRLDPEPGALGNFLRQIATSNGAPRTALLFREQVIAQAQLSGVQWIVRARAETRQALEVEAALPLQPAWCFQLAAAAEARFQELLQICRCRPAQRGHG